MDDIARAIRSILAPRERVPPERAALVGLAGIDGSGKGYGTARNVARLQGRGLRAAVINAGLRSQRCNLGYGRGRSRTGPPSTKSASILCPRSRRVPTSGSPSTHKTRMGGRPPLQSISAR